MPLAVARSAGEQQWFNQFPLGVWPDLFPGVKSLRDLAALVRYVRPMRPNTGPFNFEVTSGATAALFQRIGPNVLVTHSQAGGPGWVTA